MIIKAREGCRLVPGIACEFFRKNPKEFERLKSGEAVKVPEKYEEEVKRAFGSTVEQTKVFLKRNSKE